MGEDYGHITRFIDREREKDAKEREKFVSEALAAEQGKVYESVLQDSTVSEVLHWLKAIGGEVTVNTIGRLITDRSNAFKTKEIIKDLAAFIPAHLIAEIVGRVYFPESDWPATLLSPLLAGCSNYLLRNDTYQAIFAGVGAFLNARWNPNHPDIQALTKAWQQHFLTEANPDLSSYDIDDPASHKPDQVRYATLLQKLAVSDIGSSYLNYDEYIHMPKFSMRYLDGAMEIWHAENSNANPNKAKFFFKTQAAVDGYAKAHGFVAWAAKTTNPSDHSDKPYSIIYFFSQADWNRMWYRATEKGDLPSPRDFFWVEGGDGGRSGVGNIVGLHPALYQKVFQMGRSTIEDVLTRG